MLKLKTTVVADEKENIVKMLRQIADDLEEASEKPPADGWVDCTHMDEWTDDRQHYSANVEYGTIRPMDSDVALADDMLARITG